MLSTRSISFWKWSTVFKLNRTPYSRFKSSISARTASENDQEDKPVVFSQSPAAKWKAKRSRIGGNEIERLWYEPYVIFGSLAVFLVYFCILREENSYDRELRKSLYSRIDGLEEHQLKTVLQHNIQEGLDTKAITDRLQEIQKQKYK